MRKLFFFLLSVVCFVNIHAQTTQSLWAATPYGGAFMEGTMLRMNTDGTGLVKVADFNMCISEDANGYLIQASNGLLYGTSFWGGCAHSCNIFSCDPVTGICNDVYEFQAPTGFEPFGGVCELNNILYGTTYNGGGNGDGVFYSFDLASGTYMDILDFDMMNGGNPRQSPVVYNGKIYGLTPQGGTHGDGVIYCYDPADSTFTVVHNFSQAEGGNALAPLTVGSDGKLYGFASWGGANNKGTLYSYDVTSGICTDLYDFSITTGAVPMCSPVEVAPGVFCGTTSEGGSDSMGVIFSFNSLNGTYHVLHDFTTGEGASSSTLCFSPNGQLFGATISGTNNSYGTIYSLDLLSGNFSTLYNLNNYSGTCPNGGFVIATAPEAVNEPSVSGNSISIFPSPVHDFLNITSSSDDHGNWVVTNSLGQEVMKWENAAAMYEQRIDVSDLESGIYFLEMNNGSEVVTKKFMKE